MTNIKFTAARIIVLTVIAAGGFTAVGTMAAAEATSTATVSTPTITPSPTPTPTPPGTDGHTPWG
ncbi:hypothetical protein [Sphaerisporangium flaviroseum]